MAMRGEESSYRCSSFQRRLESSSFHQGAYMPKRFYVYILASDRNGTLYIGMSSNWQRRITEHKEHFLKGFTDKYNVTKLVWIEEHASFSSAATRESQLKAWQRKWKLRLIEELNPDWEDLTEKQDFIIS
jgi:putative endonuclease